MDRQIKVAVGVCAVVMYGAVLVIWDWRPVDLPSKPPRAVTVPAGPVRIPECNGLRQWLDSHPEITERERVELYSAVAATSNCG